MTALLANEYQCAVCRQVFEKGWSDEEAEAELAQNFTGFAPEDCGIVCDDCYRKLGMTP